MQGTLYPDVVESGGGTGTANIKSHHNVGGLPDDLQFALVEPLRTLFKDEVRAVGEQLGLPEAMVWRQPFPGPGLGIRIIGEVTRERLDVLREADAIAREELTAAGLDRDIWQCPVVLLADVRSVGVQGDGRTYGHPIVLRPVSSEDAMTADWTRLPYDLLARISTRITNEVRRGQPGRARRHQQAAGHHRVGVTKDPAAPHASQARRGPRSGAVPHRHLRWRALRSSQASRATPATISTPRGSRRRATGPTESCTPVMSTTARATKTQPGTSATRSTRRGRRDGGPRWPAGSPPATVGQRRSCQPVGVVGNSL